MRSIWERIARTGTKVIHDPNIPTSCVLLQNGHVVMRLGKLYLEGDQATRSYLIEHELSHLARGDLLVKDVDPKGWNIASDACIHTHLMPTMGNGPDNIVTLAKLHEDIPATRSCDGSRARPIYDALPVQHCGFGCGTCPQDDMTPEERAAAEFARAVASQDAGESPIQPPPRKTPPQYVETATERLVRRLAARMRSIRGGVITRRRSWSRPGRLPILAGTARIRGPRIAVLIDRSGSMEAAHAAMDYIGNLGVEVIYIAWAVTATVCATPGDVWAAEVGGGTLLAPALALLDTLGADHAVIVSDAMLGDMPPPPRTPVTWVVVGSNAPPWGDAIWTQ